jgi:hypothetical protein
MSEEDRDMSKNSNVAVEEVNGRNKSHAVLVRPERLHFTREGECVVVIKDH